MIQSHPIKPAPNKGTSMSFPPGWGDDALSEHMGNAISNARAIFACMKPQYERLACVDRSFLTICNNLSNNLSNQVVSWSSLLLMVRARFGYRAACLLIISGQITESFPILRACLEYSLYALHISKNKVALEAWLKRDRDDASKKAMLSEFRMQELQSTLKTIDPKLSRGVQILYERCIDFGAHPNPMAVASNLTFSLNSGEFEIKVQAMHSNPEVIESEMKFAEKIGLACLLILGNVFPECLKSDEIDVAIMKLQEALPSQQRLCSNLLTT